MTSHRPQTPSGPYQSVPTPHDPAHLSRGYGAAHGGVEQQDFAHTPANLADPSPLPQTLQSPQSQRTGRFEEDFDARTRGSSILDGELPNRSASRASMNAGATPSRSGTLKKRSSVKRASSMKRSGSRRSTYAGSIRGVSADPDEERGHKHNSVFYTPVPTTGSPTDILANRFQAWRKLLKDIITYFREVAASYEHRAKSLLRVSNVINNTNAPSLFMTEGGLNDANRIMRDFHKQSIAEANKAREIEHEVINQLGGLRADLGQKIKEIKSLSGDFKNSVEKEKETTRKCVAALDEALALVESDPAAIAGKGDPYVVRLGVDRQVERQIDEENYLHRAYLNLENSGRELESIVVGEVQKAYNALASIMKHEADEIYSTVERLRSGPIGMPRDLEWNDFVLNDPHFVNPNAPLRRLEEIEYPGKHHPATTEVRAGMLERKSKYLKSYTPGWYVLSPTHLHEFKSADRIYTQPPVMSLYLPEQKLGSHSQPGSSSHKFVLKGRQTGSMHRGHTWVFRAETYDTMLAWYEDIKSLTEKSGEERDAFVRRHARSVSQGSARSVASSDGALDEDEADQIPYASQSISQADVRDEPPHRPSPGGRFPSDMQLDRNSQAPLSPSSGSSEVGHDLTTASGGLQDASFPHTQPTNYYPNLAYQQDQMPQSATAYQNNYDSTHPDAQNPVPQNNVPFQNTNEYAYGAPQQHQSYHQPETQTSQYPSSTPDYQHLAPAQAQPQIYQPLPDKAPPQPNDGNLEPPERHNSSYGEWMAPVAAGATGGALGAAAYQQHQQHQPQEVTASHAPQPTSTQDASSMPFGSQPIDNTTTAAPQNPILSTDSADLSFLDVSGAVPAPSPVAAPPAAVEPSPSSVRTSITSVGPSPVASTVVEGEMGGKTGDGVGSANPAMRRQNTDFSVSDLHVPGKYPRGSGSGS